MDFMAASFNFPSQPAVGQQGNLPDDDCRWLFAMQGIKRKMNVNRKKNRLPAQGSLGNPGGSGARLINKVARDRVLN
ncbi:MAG: hypothetical protein M0009_06765 [Deltaproteobacteria bacterium]|nr:hypothetical protein [Deltaproteobacteria bacterium]